MAVYGFVKLPDGVPLFGFFGIMFEITMMGTSWEHGGYTGEYTEPTN